VVEVSDKAGNTGAFEGELVEAARTKALTEDEVRTHLARLGNTPYVMDALRLTLDSKAGLGFSTLHKARREALADYELRRFFGGVARSEGVTTDFSMVGRSTRAASPVLSPDLVAVVSSLSAAKAALNAGANEAQLNAWLLQDVEPGADLVPVLPRIAHDHEQDTYYGIAERFGRAVCSTLGQLATCQARGISAEAHWSLNVTNAYSALALVKRYGVTRIWLSPELSERQIASIAASCPVPVGAALFGQQEVMVTENCVLSGLADSANPCTRRCAGCKRRARHLALRDKKGYCFPLATDPTGRSHLYNSIPLDLSGALPELLETGISALRLDLELALNTQASREIARARRNLIAVAGGNDLEVAPNPNAVTKGHFYRGVL